MPDTRYPADTIQQKQQFQQQQTKQSLSKILSNTKTDGLFIIMKRETDRKASERNGQKKKRKWKETGKVERSRLSVEWLLLFSFTTWQFEL